MTQDEVIRIARDVWGAAAALLQFADIERFAALVAAHEREECAKVCDEAEDQAWAQWKAAYKSIDQGRSIGAEECAFAIRARGES